MKNRKDGRMEGAGARPSGARPPGARPPRLKWIGFRECDLVMLRGALATFLMGERYVKWTPTEMGLARKDAWRLLNTIWK